MSFLLLEFSTNNTDILRYTYAYTRILISGRDAIAIDWILHSNCTINIFLSELSAAFSIVAIEIMSSFFSGGRFKF